MKALILAAGYGIRLQNDILNNNSFSYLKDLPKQLISIGNKLLIDYLISQINDTQEVEQVYVVTNNYYYNQFLEWAKNTGFPVSNIINDGTNSNKKRKGSIKDISIVIEEKEINDDMLIVAGDTLFDCNLKELIQDFQKKGNLVAYYDASDEEVKKRGIIEISNDGKIVRFLEKPNQDKTKSRLACPPLYLYKKETIANINQFLNDNKELKSRDAPGNLVKWLVENKHDIYAKRINGRIDVGNLKDLEKALVVYEK